MVEPQHDMEFEAARSEVGKFKKQELAKTGLSLKPVITTRLGPMMVAVIAVVVVLMVAVVILLTPTAMVVTMTTIMAVTSMWIMVVVMEVSMLIGRPEGYPWRL